MLSCSLSLSAQTTLNAPFGHANYQWFIHNGVSALPIASATDSVYSPTMPGIFYATFDESTCGSNATEYFVATCQKQITFNTFESYDSIQWSANSVAITGENFDSCHIVPKENIVSYSAELFENGCVSTIPAIHVVKLEQSVCAIFPIELLSFDVLLSNDESFVDLSWVTASEINGDYFEVERSRNAVDWSSLLTQKATGNSNLRIEYTDLDDDPYLGTSYYRLKLYDLDGTFSYSKIRVIHIGTKPEALFKLFPNPAVNQITLKGIDLIEKDIRIIDLLGRDVSKYITVTSASNKAQIDVSYLAQGFYLVLVGKQVIKFEKMGD